MSRLTTHVLDLAHGRPAGGMAVRLTTVHERTVLTETVTNADGRCDEPLLAGAAFKSGTFRLEFEVAAYFRSKGAVLPDPPFLDVVALEFGIEDAASHYHVPLLVSPFGYSTYRGS